MAKQLRIPNTERKDHPEIEEACIEFDRLDSEWGEAGKRRENKRLEIGALLRTRKLKHYKYYSKLERRYRIAKLEDQEPKLKFVDTDEGVEEVGEGVSEGNGVSDNVHPGLITQALNAQKDINVEESSDGEVVVPEKSAPKAKRGGGKKKKSN